MNRSNKCVWQHKRDRTIKWWYSEFATVSIAMFTVYLQFYNKRKIKKAKNNIDAKITKKLTVRVVQSIGRFINDVQQQQQQQRRRRPPIVRCILQFFAFSFLSAYTYSFCMNAILSYEGCNKIVCFCRRTLFGIFVVNNVNAFTDEGNKTKRHKTNEKRKC